MFTDRHTFIHTLHTISTDVVSQNWQNGLWEVRSGSMAGYRRLISYIYAYEGEEKGKTLVSRSWKPGTDSAV